MAVTARRTVAKVKSSAINPRHPEVPNLIGEEVTALYSSPELQQSKEVRAMQANTGIQTTWEDANDSRRTKPNRVGDLRFHRRGAENCQHGGEEAPGGVREHRPGPSPIDVPLEGEGAKHPGSLYGHQDHREVSG